MIITPATLQSAYFLAPWRNKTLIFTCDGNGDGDCGTVWIGNGNDLECRLRIPSVHSIGGLVARTTRFLGMSPWQDEYKVMGMAPWGELKENRAARAYAEFSKMWTLDGLGYRNRIGYAGDALIPVPGTTYARISLRPLVLWYPEAGGGDSCRMGSQQYEPLRHQSSCFRRRCVSECEGQQADL